MKKTLAFSVLIMSSMGLHAQWSVQPAIGISNPITGYKSISGSGPLYQVEINKSLKPDRWSIGLYLGWCRLHNDNNSNDVFENARLDQIPILINGQLALTQTKLVPYLGLGLGVSLYNFTFEPTPMSSESEFNASFSIRPAAGLRYTINERLRPFAEVNAPLVMDGPPVGAADGDKVTGCIGIAAGVSIGF